MLELVNFQAVIAVRHTVRNGQLLQLHTESQQAHVTSVGTRLASLAAFVHATDTFAACRCMLRPTSHGSTW